MMAAGRTTPLLLTADHLHLMDSDTVDSPVEAWANELQLPDRGLRRPSETGQSPLPLPGAFEPVEDVGTSRRFSFSGLAGGLESKVHP